MIYAQPGSTSAEKLCGGCGVIKPLAEFNHNRNRKDGRGQRCKPCASAAARAWEKQHPDRRREARRQSSRRTKWWLRRPSRATGAGVERSDAARARALEMRTARLREGIPLGLCQCGCGGATNLARATQPERGAIQGEPNLFIKGHSLRGQHLDMPLTTRQSIRQREGSRGAREARRDRAMRAWAQILVADPCVYCGGVTTSLDHIEAVTRGGAASWDNLTGACSSCNSAKGPRPLLMFLLARLP